MHGTKSEIDGKVVTIEEFGRLICIERQKQHQLYGVNPQFSLHRWLAIITEELGKLAKATNELTKTFEQEEFEEEVDQHLHQLHSLQFRARNQLLQVATCCLATLQESPSLRLQRLNSLEEEM